MHSINTANRVRWKWPSIILLISLTLSITNGQDVKTKKIRKCEGEIAKLECGESEQIEVELSNFGRFALAPCNPDINAEFTTNCGNNATKLVLANRCDGKNSCEFVVGPAIFGDPCPGTSKYLDAKYSCVHITTTVSPPTQSTHLMAPDNSKTPNNDVKYSIEKSKNCPAILYRSIHWPESRPSELAKGKCSADSHGNGNRLCLPNGQWDLNTDLSGCVSIAFHNLQDDFKELWELDFMITTNMIDDVQQFVRTQKLLAGDLIQLSHLLYKINAHNQKSAFTYNRPQLSATTKLMIQILNDVLQINQRDAWLDLLPGEQSRVAYRFLRAIEQALRNVARSITSSQTEAEMFVSRPAVLGIATVVKGQQTMELPTSSSYEIEDRVLFSLSDSELGREYEIIYAAIADLGQFLMQSSQKNQGSNECDKMLISKVLSTWSGVRSLVPQEDEVALVLSFSTRKPDPSLQVQCAKWSNEQKGFFEDGSCIVLEHNSTQTICRCLGTGHYAVIGSSCDSQIYFGINKETVALFASCFLVVFFMFIYIIGLSAVKQNQPNYVFIRRNFCVALVLTEFLLCIWFLLPRHGIWSSIMIYFLHGLIITVTWWLLIQMFQLFYSLLHLIHQRQVSSHLLHYIIGYSIPLILTILLIISSGNISLFLHGYQPLQKPADLLISVPLLLLMFMHLLFVMFTCYLLVKRFRVGYIPCKTDADNLLAIRRSLIHLAPLVVAIDAFCFVSIQFSLHPIKIWLWLVIGANVLQFLVTVRVLSFRRLCSGCFFDGDEKKQLRANDLPKTAIFSPAVQSNGQNFNFPYNDPAYMKNQGSSVGHFTQQPIYIPSNIVHSPHECNCLYETIPHSSECDYYAFYNNQHTQHNPHNQNYQIYQQNPANPTQIQRSMPPTSRPPAPPNQSHSFRSNEHHQIYNQHIDEQSPICNEHGRSCASLAALRLSNSQLYHHQHPLQQTDSSYETARSSSTSGTTSSVASSGTFLLRFDPTQQNPLFFEENS